MDQERVVLSVNLRLRFPRRLLDGGWMVVGWMVVVWRMRNRCFKCYWRKSCEGTKKRESWITWFFSTPFLAFSFTYSVSIIHSSMCCSFIMILDVPFQREGEEGETRRKKWKKGMNGQKSFWLLFPVLFSSSMYFNSVRLKLSCLTHHHTFRVWSKFFSLLIRKLVNLCFRNLYSSSFDPLGLLTHRKTASKKYHTVIPVTVFSRVKLVASMYGNFMWNWRKNVNTTDGNTFSSPGKINLEFFCSWSWEWWKLFMGIVSGSNIRGE